MTASNDLRERVARAICERFTAMPERMAKELVFLAGNPVGEFWTFGQELADAAIAILTTDVASLYAYEAGLREAARVAEHLNGWGTPRAPDLANHIAACIRALAGEQG